MQQPPFYRSSAAISSGKGAGQGRAAPVMGWVRKSADE